MRVNATSNTLSILTLYMNKINLFVDKSKHQQNISDTYIINMVDTAEIKTKSVIFMDSVSHYNFVF